MGVTLNGTEARCISLLNTYNYLPQANVFTISTWFKTTSHSGIDHGDIVARATTASEQYEIEVQNSILYVTVGGTSKNTAQIVNDGLWHHAAVVNWNNAGTYRFYAFLDGVKYDTNTASGAAAGTYDTYIGGHADTAPRTLLTELFNGQIADVRFYNRALTDNELISMYNMHGHDAIVQNLQGRYSLVQRAPGQS